MASFVEQATLKLIDESSGKVRKINSELKKLFATANKMRNMRIDIGGLTKAQGDVRKLSSELNKLKRPVKLDVRANTAQARSQVSRLVSDIAKIPKSKTMRLNVVQNGIVPNVPQGAGPQQRYRVPRVPPVTVNVAPLNTLLNGFVARLGYTIESAIVNGFKQGFAERDVADTRLRLQDLTREQQSFAQRAASQLSRDKPILGRGQALGLIGEVLPVAQGNVDAANKLSGTLADLIALQVATGADQQTALDSAINLLKAAEQQGRVTDAQGNVDPAEFERFAALIVGAMAQGGKEITSNLIRGVTQGLQSAKFSLDDKGILSVIALAEEQGVGAGGAIFQAIKNLSGESASKKVINNLAAMGLLTTQQVEAGKVGGATLSELFGQGAVDEAELRSNILGWVTSQLIPKMREQGLDPNNAVDTAKFAGQIASERSAKSAISSLIQRAQELNTWVERAQELAKNSDQLQSIIDQSGLAQLASVRTQFNSLLGEIANSLEKTMIPVLKSTASALGSLSEFIAGPIGEGDPGRAAAVGAAGLTVGAGALFAGKKFIDFFNPLTGSATALTGSATALDASAAALMRAAAAQGAGGVADAAGDVPGGKNGGFWKSLARTLGVAALTAGAFEAFKAAAESENGRRLREEGGIDKFLAEVKAANSPEMNAERERNNVMRNAVEKLIAELTTINTRVDQQLRDVPRDLFTKSRLTGEEQSIVNALKLGDLESQAASAANALGTIPSAVSRTDEIINALRTPTVAQSALDLKPLGESSIFDFGVDTLESSASRFDAIFTTGANDISAGGDQAGNAIATGGMQAGQAIASSGDSLAAKLQSAIIAGGNQAAAAISAAGANIRVNVNQGSPVNTGATSVPVE